MRRKQPKEEAPTSPSEPKEKATRAKRKRRFPYIQEGEELNTANAIKSFTKKTAREIIEKGTIKEKLFLFISDHELCSFVGAKSELTEEDKREVITFLESKLSKQQLNHYFAKFNCLNFYAPTLATYYHMHLIQGGLLARLVDKWAAYEQTATDLTTLFQTLNRQTQGKEEELLKPFLAIGEAWEDAELIFYPEKHEFAVNINGEGMLYPEIIKHAGSAAYLLSVFKGAAEAVIEWNEGDNLPTYLPISIQMSLQLAEGEFSLISLIKDKKYLMSSLNSKIDKGEVITERDRVYAVFPDYFKVEVNKTANDVCKSSLNNIMRRYK